MNQTTIVLSVALSIVFVGLVVVVAYADRLIKAADREARALTGENEDLMERVGSLKRVLETSEDRVRTLHADLNKARTAADRHYHYYMRVRGEEQPPLEREEIDTRALRYRFTTPDVTVISGGRKDPAYVEAVCVEFRTRLFIDPREDIPVKLVARRIAGDLIPCIEYNYAKATNQ